MRDDKSKLGYELEPRLTEALQRVHSDLEIPDGEQAWELMSRRLQEEKRVNPWLDRMKLAVVAASLTLIIHLLFWTVDPVQAITRYYFKVYRSQEVTDVSFGNYNMDAVDESKMLTAPPPEEDRHGRFVRGETIILAPGESPPVPSMPPMERDPLKPVSTADRLEFATLEEAAGMIGFTVYLPEYLPEGYSLSKVIVFPSEGMEKAGTAHLEFWNGSTRDMIMLYQHPVSGQFGMASTYGDPNAVVKEVKVNGGRGVLVMTGGGSFANLQWFNDSMNYQLRGRFSEKEAMKIANSMKKTSE